MNDGFDPETPIYNELMRQRQTKPSATPIYDQLLFEYQAQNKLLEEDHLNKMQQSVTEFQEASGGTVNEAPRIPSTADMDDSIASMTAELNREGGLIDSIQKQDLIGVATGIGEMLYEVFSTATVFGIDAQPIFDEIHKAAMSKATASEVYAPQIGLELNKQSTYGHEDTTVYRTREIPLTLGIGGPKIGSGKIVMEHNGDVMFEGTMDDVSTLPVIDHLGFAVSGMSIGDDEPQDIPMFFPDSMIDHNKAVVLGEPFGGSPALKFGEPLALPEKETTHISATGPIEQNSFELVAPPYDR